MPTDGQSGHPHAVSSAPMLYLHIHELTVPLLMKPQDNAQNPQNVVTSPVELSLLASARLIYIYIIGFEGVHRLTRTARSTGPRSRRGRIGWSCLQGLGWFGRRT